MIRSMRSTLLALAGLLLAELGCSSDSAAPDSFVGQTVDAAVSPPPDAAPAGPTAYRITSLAVVEGTPPRVAGVVHLHDLWRTEMF